MTDTTSYIQRLLDTNPLREPWLRSVIRVLGFPSGSHGLDAGCGIGLQTLLLAEAVGSQGRVTGLDILPELLAYGENRMRKAGLSERITFREGDVSKLPFEEKTFDWVWSADCIGYPAGELTPNCSAYIPFLRGKSPELNFTRAMRWFWKARLEDVQAQKFVRDIQGPLTEDERTGLILLFHMLWKEPQSEADAEDWEEYQGLSEPDSADFILDLPDYFGFFTYSVFRGKVQKAR